MLHMIRETEIGKDEWMRLLKRGRRIYLQDQFDRLSSHRSDPDMLELTSFSDKNKILERLMALDNYSPYLPPKSFIDQLSEITILRNNIAHTGNDTDNDDILQEFIGRLRLANQWMQ